MEQIIEQKLEQIREQKEKVKADFQALNGAEQVLVQLLNEMKESDVNELCRD